MSTASQIVPVNIEDEMKESYLSYSMSVIVGRALPDVRDGLKPVHRRILYGMYELGNEWNKPYKKSARIVGDVMGKYHPHGDAAIYDALVRMAQDFSMRYPLIDGQGNFGSIDGDPPAAMRYTEVRLARIAGEMLADIDKETVDFVPNYDGSASEPTVLPARVPNLLLNGASGIAVGMSTNIPPHNLGELVDAIVAQIRNPKISIDELMNYIPGPDFPTGGFICGRDAIKEAYATGRGVIKIRARARIEKQKKGERESIIITEIPYQVNKAKLIERIADLVKSEKIQGISDIRDESDREGIRIVLELKRGENPKVILNQLYKHTPMDTSFGIIMLALVRNQPRILSLKELINQFIEHRKEIVTRRTEFELRKAEERLHILEGIKVALDHIDEVISLIRNSSNPSEAKEQLVLRLSLSEVQAQAILDMRLQRLTALEREKIIEERDALKETIRNLKGILESEELLLDIIVSELEDIKKRYGDERRTEILDNVEELSIEDLIADENMVVTITHEGYIKTTPLSVYRSQRRGGKGKTGITTKEEDFVEAVFVASTHSYLLFFTNLGRCYWLKVHEIPEAGPTARGKAIVNLLNLSPEESIAAVLPVREFKENQFVIMATKKGIVKKTDLMAYSNPRAGGIIAVNVREGDELIGAKISSGDDEVLLTTRMGQAIRFHEKEVRDMGRTATGVVGIKLGKGDEVVSLEVIHDKDAQILTVTEMGYGKRTPVSEYRVTGRGGKGVMTIKTTEKNGSVVGAFQVTDDNQIILITTHGKIIRMEASEIKVYGRGTQGLKLIDLEPGEKVAAVAKVVEDGKSIEL
ncbi:MAG: DNA gyrase subunit A [Deltaproteobacteria bacterium]|jgi:DNA gyrase subunit A|nr:MAG: DNA gyrase subunit A [Deltaproteobacteria bacterium]